MNLIMQSVMDRLRPLVGSKGWDYCVLWKLSEDQRFIEWINCCCGGSENAQNGGDEELRLPVSPVLPCRDTMFLHPKTNSCDLLAQLPISMPLDAGYYLLSRFTPLVSVSPFWFTVNALILSNHEFMSRIYAQTMINSQPSWLNSSSVTCSHVLEEPVGTRILIPLPSGLIELFVNKQPQVEVAQIDGNEFFVKVFCEHKAGRFVRLMKALNYLALEVTNASVTTFRNLVSNVLKAEKDNKTVIQADHLRDYLLELTRNPSRGLSEMSKASENGSKVDYQYHNHHQPTY